MLIFSWTFDTPKAQGLAQWFGLVELRMKG